MFDLLFLGMYNFDTISFGLTPWRMAFFCRFLRAGMQV